MRQLLDIETEQASEHLGLAVSLNDRGFSPAIHIVARRNVLPLSRSIAEKLVAATDGIDSYPRHLISGSYRPEDGIAISILQYIYLAYLLPGICVSHQLLASLPWLNWPRR